MRVELVFPSSLHANAVNAPCWCATCWLAVIGQTSLGSTACARGRGRGTTRRTSRCGALLRLHVNGTSPWREAQASARAAGRFSSALRLLLRLLPPDGTHREAPVGPAFTRSTEFRKRLDYCRLTPPHRPPSPARPVPTTPAPSFRAARLLMRIERGPDDGFADFGFPKFLLFSRRENPQWPRGKPREPQH